MGLLQRLLAKQTPAPVKPQTRLTGRMANRTVIVPQIAKPVTVEVVAADDDCPPVKRLIELMDDRFGHASDEIDHIRFFPHCQEYIKRHTKV